MAGLHFDITAENKNLLRKLEEIKRGVREAAKQMEESGNQAKDAINQAGNKIRFGESLKKQAREAEAALDDLTQKITNQRVTVREVESDVKRLTKAYSGLSRYSTKRDSALSELNAAKRALEEEKNTLFGLQTEHRNTRLSTKRLKDELTQYRSEQTQVVGSNTNMAASFRKTLAAIGGVAVIKQLGSAIIQVRGEFQSMQVAIETLVGKDMAGRLIPQIKELAKISPLTMSDMVGAEKMMLGFNIQAEDTIKYLKAISDISMGESGKFNSLTLAFSQMSAAGKLMGQDLNQMINAGFNPLQQISEKTGKSIAILKEEMSKGAISAQMVQQAFIDATNAGGKFYGMSENASKTINGQLSMMQDALDGIFNELGEKGEGAIIKGIQTTTNLIKNYEVIGKVLIGMIATYGAAKVAIIAYDLIVNRLALSTALLKAGIKATTLEQIKLNATMLKNPYALVVLAIGALITTLWALRDSTTAAELAQRKFNNAVDELNKKEEKRRQKIQQLLNTIQDETETDYAKIKAYEELKRLSPMLTAAYDLEKLKVLELEDANKKLNEERDKADYDSIIANINKYSEYVKRMNKGGEVMSNVGTFYPEIVAEYGGNTTWKERRERAIQDLKKWESALKDYESRKKKAEENSRQNQIEEKALTVLQRKLALTKELSEAESKLKTLRAPESKASDQEIEAAQKKVDETKARLKALTGISTKEGNDLLKSQAELSRSILDSDLKLQEMRLSIMEDGRKKRLEQSELEYEQQKSAIDKEYQDTVQKYKDQHKPVPNSVKTTYEARLGANNAAKVARDNRIEDDYLNERKEHEAALTAYLLTEEDKRKKAIKDRYDAEREWAKKQFEGENMTEEEYKAYSAKIDTAEAEDSLNELLEKYQSYTDKRLRIEQDFEKQRKELEKSGASQETLNEVDYQREEALKAVDEEFASRQEEYQGWCNQIANLSLEQLMLLLEQAKTELDKMENSGVSDNKLATQRAKVNKLQEQIRSEKTSTTPEKRSIEQWQKLHKTLSDVKGEFEDIGASVGGVAGEFLSAAGDIAGSAISMIDGIVTLSNSSAMAMQGTAAAAATSISMVEKASVILAVISAALQIATKIASLIKGKSKSELDAERMEAVTNRIADSEKIINSYIEKRIDLIKQATREEQKYLAATTKQSIANQRSYYENLFKSLRGNDLLSKEGKNNNLTAEQLGIRSIEDLKKFFDSERLQSFLRKGYDLRDFDKWKEIVDAYDALAKKEKDLAENTAKNLTGITLDDAQSALDEFLKNADTSMEDVAGSFENYMRDAMLGIVKQNTLNKALEDWYNHFEQAMDSGEGLDETEVKNLQQEYENAFTTAQQSYESMLKAAGMSLESDSSGRAASAKSGIAASQDSVNELNGNFSALLIYSNKTAENTSSLRESMNYILEIQRAGWGDVRAIKELTSQMRAHTEKISELSEMIESNTKKAATGIDTLNTKGIYLKK